MAKFTVLVADDDQDIRDGIEIYLKNEGYDVLKAADGKEALELSGGERRPSSHSRHYDAEYGWHYGNI